MSGSSSSQGAALASPTKRVRTAAKGKGKEKEASTWQKKFIGKGSGKLRTFSNMKGKGVDQWKEVSGALGDW